MATIAPAIPKEDRYWAELYDRLLTRYMNLPDEQAVPYTAVRLLVKRYGFDIVMGLLVTRGVGPVAERCRNELVVRQEFVARMIAEWPPDDAEAEEAAIEEMASDLAIIDTPEGGMRMLKYLDRLRERELKFRALQKTVH